MNAVFLINESKYSYHKYLYELFADVLNKVMQDKGILTNISFIERGGKASHEVYAAIGSPDCLFTFDFTGFDILTSGDTLALNGLSCKCFNFVFRGLSQFSKEMKMRQNFSMFTFVKPEENLNEFRNKYFNIPNIYSLCPIEYLVNNEEEMAANREQLLLFFAENEQLKEYIYENTDF